MMKDVVFFDTEIGVEDKRIHDIGAMRNRVPFHSVKLSDFLEFIGGAEFICGHMGSCLKKKRIMLPEIHLKKIVEV